LSYKDLFDKLSSITQARLNLGISGVGMPTKPLLAFNYDHSLAKDAVYAQLNIPILQRSLAELGLECNLLTTQASTREIYLKRPDLGRKLDKTSLALLTQKTQEEKDVVVIISDGLSAKAIQNHAVPFLKELLPNLNDLRIGKIMLVENGRVALSDEIGENTPAKLCILLIGERPGLSSPDSMGIYLTYGPKVGNTDEKRNCISNIHRHGLSYKLASFKLTYLIRESLHLKLSGVHLKEDTTLRIED